MMLGPMSIYVDDDIVIIHHESSITTGKVINRQSDIVTFETDNHCMITMYGYIVNGTSCLFCLHNDKGPALIMFNKGDPHCYFAYMGIISCIEDLPIDPLLKLVLKLKYGDIDVYDFCYNID